VKVRGRRVHRREPGAAPRVDGQGVDACVPDRIRGGNSVQCDSGTTASDRTDIARDGAAPSATAPSTAMDTPMRFTTTVSAVAGVVLKERARLPIRVRDSPTSGNEQRQAPALISFHADCQISSAEAESGASWYPRCIISCVTTDLARDFGITP
jgi:hypothetical protein